MLSHYHLYVDGAYRQGQTRQEFLEAFMALVNAHPEPATQEFPLKSQVEGRLAYVDGNPWFRGIVNLFDPNCEQNTHYRVWVCEVEADGGTTLLGELFWADTSTLQLVNTAKLKQGMKE